MDYTVPAAAFSFPLALTRVKSILQFEILASNVISNHVGEQKCQRHGHDPAKQAGRIRIVDNSRTAPTRRRPRIREHVASIGGVHPDIPESPPESRRDGSFPKPIT